MGATPSDSNDSDLEFSVRRSNGSQCREADGSTQANRGTLLQKTATGGFTAWQTMMGFHGNEYHRTRQTAQPVFE